MKEDNEQLITHLRDDVGVLEDERVVDAFRRADRGYFVLPDHLPEAYEDYPLPIGYDQTISQPTVVAFMLEKLQPEPGHEVLDVGSGSGWTTALLAFLVGGEGRVVGVERVPELVDLGRRNLMRFDLPQSNIINWRDLSGEFDRILVNAALDCERQGEKIFGPHLREGGVMVASVENRVVVFVKNDNSLSVTATFSGFRFVPFIE